MNVLPDEGPERVEAVDRLLAFITADVAHWADVLTFDGWPVEEAAAAIGDWWRSRLEAAIQAGVEHAR